MIVIASLLLRMKSCMHVFNEEHNEIKENFLNRIPYGQYHLKEFVNTQAKVEEYFVKKLSDA